MDQVLQMCSISLRKGLARVHISTMVEAMALKLGKLKYMKPDECESAMEVFL